MFNEDARIHAASAGERDGSGAAFPRMGRSIAIGLLEI
jgi:hypothetical protein